MRVPLSEIFLTFLKIGATGFGGPIALIALIERECRERKSWISIEEYNEAVLFCKLLPGPLAYQVALWVGRKVRGTAGGLVACLGFLLPGFCLILALSIFYSRIHTWKAFDGILGGVRSSAMVVILFSVWKLATPYKQSPRAWVLAVAGGTWMTLFPRWEPIGILAGGLGMIAWRSAKRSKAVLSVEPFSASLLATLFWVHFKAGAFVYGTGVAVLPFLEQEAVHFQHWMSAQEFLDGIAFGQITPGPLTIASTFIGYRAAGVWGSIVATFGMYLPGMLLVLVLVPMLYDRLHGKQWLVDFQEGAMPVVIGGIFAAFAFLVPAAIGTPALVVQTLAMGILVWRYPKIPAWAVMILGGVVGWVSGAGGL